MNSHVFAVGFALLAILSTAVDASAGARPAPVVLSEGPATQMATTQYVVRSAATGRTYLVKVTAPFTPARSGELRPVVYALDGGYEVAGPIGWIMGGAGGMRQAYIVSVGYLPSDYPWRDHDLAFRAYEDEGRRIDRGAAAFRAFLDAELRPWIAGRLPVDDRQAILLGHSEAALFAANVLADRPDEFAGYVIASPSVWSDPTIVDRLRAALPRIRDCRIYLAVGGAETPRMLAGEHDIAAVLASAGPTVKVRSETFESATHLSYYPALVAAALAWMLPR